MSIRQDSIEERNELVQQYNPITGDWLSDTKDILLRFFQDFFYQMPADQHLFHFEPGDETGETAETETELIITDGGSINTDTVEKRPVLILSRGPFAYANLGLDNLVSMDRLADENERTHTDLLTGSYVVNCVSKSGLESERLALLVAKGLRTYRREIQLAGFFQLGHLVRVGQESPANNLISGDADEDFVTVPVTFPVYFQETWKATISEANLLATLKVNITSIARAYDGSLLYPDSLDDDGNPNEDSEGVIVVAWTLTEE